jgi:ATP-dependent helicase YprA (DUF1998 family)
VGLSVNAGDEVIGTERRGTAGTERRDMAGTERRGFSPGDTRPGEAGPADVLPEAPRVFLYDAYPGGIGFSAPLFGMHRELLARTRVLIAECGCESGCPTCVGPVGETGPLAKRVALRLLEHLTGDGGAEAPALRQEVSGGTERRGVSPGEGAPEGTQRRGSNTAEGAPEGTQRRGFSPGERPDRPAPAPEDDIPF